MAVRKKLVLGDRCPMAAVVQTLLRAKGYMFDGQPTIDDKFGPNCVAAARRFQQETARLSLQPEVFAGLIADGEVGEMTLRAFYIRWGVALSTLPNAFWPQE